MLVVVVVWACVALSSGDSGVDFLLEENTPKTEISLQQKGVVKVGGASELHEQVARGII